MYPYVQYCRGCGRPEDLGVPRVAPWIPYFGAILILRVPSLRGSLNDLPPGEQGRTILVLRPQCKLPCVSPKTTMRSAGRKLMTRAVLPPVFRSWYLPRATPAMKRRELDPSRFSSKDCRAHRVQARRSHAKSTPHIAGSHRLTRLNGSRLSSIPSLSCYTK